MFDNKVMTKKVENMNTISVHQFIFVMKAIAENNLWDEVAFHFEENGHGKIQFSSHQIGLLREVFINNMQECDTINRRGKIFITCGCGMTNPGPNGGREPSFPSGGREGGTGEGPRPSDGHESGSGGGSREPQ